MLFELKAMLFLVSTFLASLLGGFDKGLEVLIVMVIIDYATGIMKAIYLKKLSSCAGWKGLIKKLCIFLLVAVSVQLERIIGQPESVHNLVAYAFVVNEAISILENIGQMDVFIPKELLQFLEKVKVGGFSKKDGA